jgi:uncharacterized membrane protein
MMHFSSAARTISSGVALAIAIALSAPPAYAASYHLIDLGEAYAEAINDAGMVAGDQLGDTHPMRWHGGRWHHLRQVPNTFGSAAYAINRRGDVSGFLETAGFEFVPVLWVREMPGYKVLPLPGGATGGIATAITTGDRAAGYSFQGSCLTWDAQGTLLDLGSPRGTSGCEATGINVWGDVTVSASDRGFVWRGSHFHELPTLGGSVAVPMAIDRHGRIVGVASDSSGAEYPVFWRNDVATALSAPDSSYVELVARALSDTGIVVGDGWSNNDQAQHAVVWNDGEVAVLNDLVDELDDWNLEYATGVAADGTIVGDGSRGLESHAFMLVPLP